MGIIIQQSIKASVAHYIGVFIGFISVLFLVPLLLPPEVYGLTQVLFEAALLISALMQLGTTSSIIRFFPYFKSSDNKNNGFFFYIMALPIVGSLIFIPLYFVLRMPISNFFSKSPLFVEYYNWVVPLALFLTFWTVLETYSNVKMKIVIPRIIREIFLRIILIISYLLFYFGFLNLPQFVFSCIAPYGIVMILSFFYVSRIASVSIKHDTAFINKPLQKQILKYTIFLLAATLSGNILKQLDTFMLGSLKGLYDVGIYRVLLYMAIIVEIPMRSITSISAPIAASALKNNDLQAANDLYKKVSLHQLIFGSFIFLLVWINMDNILNIIPNGQNYEMGKWVVFFIGIERLIHVTLNFGSTLISFSKYYYWELFFTFFIFAIGIGTNYWLIPKFGITGAAIATLVTTTAVYSVRQWIVLIKIKGNPYSAGTIKQIALIFVMFLINYSIPKLGSAVFDCILRTIIIGGTAFYAMYRLQISKEICKILDSSWNKIRGK